MKILFATSCLSYGGAEKNVKMVASEMLNRGYDVVICNFNTRPTVLTFDDRIKIVDMPKYAAKGLKRIQQFLFLCKLCKIEKPDLISSFLFLPNVISVFAGKISNVPVVISERADPFQHKSVLEKIIYYFYRFADGAVFQTEGAQRYFPKSLQNKSVVIPNPIIPNCDIEKVEQGKRRKVISFVARFEIVQKRQDIMIDAFAKVLKKHPEYNLEFYGDGPDEGKIKSKVEQLGISSNVLFKGAVNNVAYYIYDTSMYVLCSDFEGIPNSLLEAMSLGLPCVSTDCSPGGARMLIDNMKNGMIVPCNDSDALCNAINYMIENPEFAEVCGSNAKEVNDKFSYQLIMDKWNDFYVSLL